MRRPAHASILLLAFLAACASRPDAPSPIPSLHAMLPTPFSLATAVNGLPAGWDVYRLLRFKPLTKYEVVPEGDVAVVRARAKASVSGLQQRVSVDLHEYPVATWRWKVPQLIEGANNASPAVADSPARVIFTFEGGRDKLPAHEQLNYDLARAFTGNDLPYATLMYIWEPDRPEGEIITHHNSTRVKMVVAGNAQRELGKWHEARVNLLADFRRAFEEEPPRVKTVGIMTDSDNTGTEVEAYFGEITFLPR